MAKNMKKIETQTLFSMIKILEEIRDLLRLTAPDHILDKSQKRMLGDYLNDLKDKVGILERMTT